MKKKVISVIFITLISSFPILLSGQEALKTHSKISAGFLTGYNTGVGFQGNIKVNNFAEDFPFELRIGIGYSFLDPGNAADARRIFINDATNGVQEKSGGMFDYRFDFLIPSSILGAKHSYFVLGPRYSSFIGNFKFVGGNEDFDVRSKQWGVGGGIEHFFKMSQRLDLVLAYGVDYFFNGSLNGHDTTYSPNNDNVNARKDKTNDNTLFNFNDADNAINQPKIMPRAMIGISFNL